MDDVSPLKSALGVIACVLSPSISVKDFGLDAKLVVQVSEEVVDLCVSFTFLCY